VSGGRAVAAEPRASGRPAVFLDRDGTIIQEKAYLADPDEVELVPGALDAMRTLRDAGYALVVVTNQSGIARGLYTLDEYRAVAARIDEVLSRSDLVVDRTEFCPHHPDVTGPCPCRKPATGMYVRAADALGIDVASSFFIGDKITDVRPALELGGTGILVRTGYGRDLESEAPPDVWVVDDLAAAARRILNER
jgi:D-glycero-D-manno-heptose 1,7-bisphosphate phosphatase